jgi:hypothetical protein
MTGEQMLNNAASIIAERGATYGDFGESVAAIAKRWSITLDRHVTPSQVVLCMIDLKLTRLRHDPTHLDSMLDIIGYTALLPEVTR